MTRLSVAVRADASSRIGSGHIMRCLALAEGLTRRGAHVIFLSRAHAGHINDEIRQRGFEVHELPAGGEAGGSGSYAGWLGVDPERDAGESIDALGGERTDWLIVDHYALDRSWEEMLRPRVGNILVIDDLADRSHSCEVLVDQGFVPEPWRRYDGLVPPRCTRLLGTDYALLRPEFAAARARLSLWDGTVRRVLVSFGGPDADDMTGRALDALDHPDLAHLEVDVVVGASNANLPTLRRRAADRAVVRLHVNTPDMAGLMSRADLALGAGGTTTWERLCLGLPSLVVTVAVNQEASIAALHEADCVIWLGTPEKATVEKIREAVRDATDDPEANRARRRRGMELVDGEGSERVADIVTAGVPPQHWRVRKAEDKDCALFWDWVNDVETRRNAFHPDAIPWADHEHWYYAKLADEQTLLLVAEADVGPIGQVRFEPSDDGYVISYSLGPQFRRLGLGRPLLDCAVRRFRGKCSGTLIGETVEGNPASARVFERLGFVEVEPRRPGSRRFELNTDRYQEYTHHGN